MKLISRTKAITLMLRQRFYAETDTKIDARSGDWKQYAEWLENQAFGKINDELIKRNEMQRNVMAKAKSCLEQGLIGRYPR